MGLMTMFYSLMALGAFRPHFPPPHTQEYKVGQFVLVSSPHVGLKTRFFINVQQLWVCRCGVLSVMRGWVCPLQFLLTLAITVNLGSQHCRTHAHILLS
jgi:hypothetical protein